MLNNTNTYLQSAKNTKNDEFYTPFEVIERELLNYREQFSGKVVLSYTAIGRHIYKRLKMCKQYAKEMATLQ